MADILIHLAVLFLLGLFAYWAGIRTALPRVTLLILVGIAIGPSGVDLFAEHRSQWFPVIADMALVMLGFLIGGSLTLRLFREQGRKIIWLSIGVAAGTFALVFGGLLLLGQGLVIAILLAAIATATDPAATSAVVMEEKAGAKAFPQTLLGIVAIDDAWGLLIFGFCLVAATGAAGDNGIHLLAQGLWEIAGAVALGVAIGLPMAFLTGRIRKGEPILVEALGLVLLCGGLALKLEVSHLLAAIVMGTTVANLAKHHRRPFHAIEGVEWPLLTLFFILAGASLEMNSLVASGILGGAYMVLRIAGKIAGGWLTGRSLGMSHAESTLTGAALLPQAGVAVAMALAASQALPELGNLLLTVTLASTVVFELIGPLVTRYALRQVGARDLPASS
jgi:Kef-type K+ transport system membrane component KefB